MKKESGQAGFAPRPSFAARNFVEPTPALGEFANGLVAPGLVRFTIWWGLPLVLWSFPGPDGRNSRSQQNLVYPHAMPCHYNDLCRSLHKEVK